jgi:predicted RNA polymerase sigma factor
LRLENAQQSIELAARESFGRLVAYLAVRTGDIASAEDALADALLGALRHWPVQGVPEHPDAWLLTAARRKLADQYRHKQVVRQSASRLKLAHEEVEAEMGERSAIPDERLKLMFVCAHPAIDAATRAPFMLQSVLGLSAEKIASAFLVSPEAMTKRLVRAKLRIKETGAAFRVPFEEELSERLADVLAAIYAAFTLSWQTDMDDSDLPKQLSVEAIWLSRVLVELLPQEPETKGLLALMLFVQSRKGARQTQRGLYVPISEQNVLLWSAAYIDEAEQLLKMAGSDRRLGRYQLEAAIHAVHSNRRLSGMIDWQAIKLLYEGLIEVSPTTGALVAQAAALCQGGRPDEGLSILDAIEQNKINDYQPYWATRAHVLQTLDRNEEAASSYANAIGLSENRAVRLYLIAKREQLKS